MNNKSFHAKGKRVCNASSRIHVRYTPVRYAVSRKYTCSPTSKRTPMYFTVRIPCNECSALCDLCPGPSGATRAYAKIGVASESGRDTGMQWMRRNQRSLTLDFDVNYTGAFADFGGTFDTANRGLRKPLGCVHFETASAMRGWMLQLVTIDTSKLIQFRVR